MQVFNKFILLIVAMVVLLAAASAQAAPVDTNAVAGAGASLDNGATIEKRQKYCLDKWGRKYPC
ncbi:hypothetical protein HK102_014028 [Quaeritorhiza haematococci]|nr:hypothetical protein HK102_014028 [Quaeritorhiza haematococci]